MARLKLTHLGEFSQEFSESIPILKELDVRVRSVIECAQRTLRLIFMTYDAELTREKLDMIKDKGLPPKPYPL